MTKGSYKDYLTTGQIAALCSVTPDTVLKWIRAGRLSARRTPGGHHRVPRSALDSFLGSGESTPTTQKRASIHYCWEFNSQDGKITSECQDCVVYRSRSLRCYEISGLPIKAGHARRFCKSSCEECDYFKMVRGQAPNVLVVTDQQDVRTSLEVDSEHFSYNVKITDCEYRCSMEIEGFRPDYVVIDCSLGSIRSRDFAQLLADDPRIPFVKVILVGNGRKLPDECNKLVYALDQRRFTARTLSDLISGEIS
ncbi:MAG: excisionase family DNA-binding protein [candidate division Zixibacteria bacterium]|nr:excisionase family DNA-binding protein [candidate division Zixibacteria bacterium]